jgi:hypothetical protein
MHGLLFYHRDRQGSLEFQQVDPVVAAAAAAAIVAAIVAAKTIQQHKVS